MAADPYKICILPTNETSSISLLFKSSGEIQFCSTKRKPEQEWPNDSYKYLAECHSDMVNYKKSNHMYHSVAFQNFRSDIGRGALATSRSPNKDSILGDPI